MNKLRNKNKAGFTLIELLVVIAIIGLLASVVLLALNSARSKSRDAKRLADVRQMASALELMFNDTSAYPTSANYVAAGGALLGNGALAVGATNLTPTYIGLIPAAPRPQDNTCASSGIGGNDYWYETTTTGDKYTISFCLGQATGGYSAGTHRLTPAGIQ